MNTQAYFDNIAEQITKELQKAKQSVFIAVAWFTDAALFRLLCQKAKQGVSIQLMLMNDEINNSCCIDYKELVNAGGKVWLVSDKENILMHNKFCIIDGQIVISGSYNWTNKAKQNHESITIIEDNEIASQFIDEFNYLKKTYFGDSPEDIVIDYAQLCIRLETLKNVIMLEDSEDIDFQLRKLRKMITVSNDNTSSNLLEIINNTEKRNYSDAVTEINLFVSKYRSLTIYIDSEVTAMRLEIKALGLQISSLEDEKSEIEKLLYAFNLRYNHELGVIMEKILRLRKERLKEEAKNDESKKQEAEEAEEDYQEFNQSYQESKNKVINQLTEKQQKEIKQKYRKASKLCHPDVVNEEQSEQAKVVFQKLKSAYDENDLQTITEILSNLEKGIFVDKATEISEKQKLSMIINQLRQKRDILEQELQTLKQSETYQIIVNISDWDTYFLEKRKRLEEELALYNN